MKKKEEKIKKTIYISSGLYKKVLEKQIELNNKNGEVPTLSDLIDKSLYYYLKICDNENQIKEKQFERIVQKENRKLYEFMLKSEAKICKRIIF